MKKIIGMILLLGACLHAGEIKVAVAANLSYAMNELSEEFSHLHPDITIQLTLGSSGSLTKQIREGAQYGVFMSANMRYPQALYNEHIAISKPLPYAEGALAYFSTTKLDFTQGITLLKSPEIKNIAVANPASAPYGKAAIEAMKNAKVYEDVKHKIVYANSIGQAFSYTVMAAEIGIVSKSSLFSSKMRRYKEGVNWGTVDTALHKPIEQGIVLLKNAEGNSEYHSFYDFILSQKAKRIFQNYGYTVK